MTIEIDEAIKRYTSNAEYERTHGNLQGCLEFRQLAEWLRDYKRLKEQEPSGDLISREAAIDAFERFIHELGIDDEPYNYGEMALSVKNVPSVTPQPKTGHWILQPSNKEQGERDFIWWKCSECGQVIYSETEKDRKEFHAFCGRCGAKMEVENNG